MPVITGSTTINKDEWRTDQILFDKVRKSLPLGIDLDAAATKDNRLCPRYLSKEQDALASDWYQPELGIHTVWLNPPFSVSNDFLRKANEEHSKGATIICLLRADSPETSWWRSNLVTKYGYLRHQVLYLYPRLNYFNEEYEKVTGVPFPSCLVIMGHNRSHPFAPRWIEWPKYVDFKYLF